MSKFTHTNQKSVNKFFKKDKEQSDSDSDSDDKSDEKEKEEKQKEDRPKPTGQYFDIINPVNTVVGPIGEFQVLEENFPIHAAVALFGKRRTGKSYTLRWWMFKCFRKIPFGCVFTNTSINGFWQVGYFILIPHVCVKTRANSIFSEN
jgi:hypothetical protein